MHGRRYELSTLLFNVQSCSCCGLVKPGHDDPHFPENTPFERKHLMIKYHPAWECRCDNYCKGSQFYCAKRKTHISHYQRLHSNLNPWEVLNCNKNEPNAVLCTNCYNEVHSKNLEELEYGRVHSRRNGFGPVPIPPPIENNEDVNMTRYRRLFSLLSNLTAAEEAAIRQITPLISIVRLNHGNIGCKGNTSCVWQKSKLNLILPNLPEECKFIIITRRNKKKDEQKKNANESKLKSTTFERKKIQETLELLSKTVVGVWKPGPNFNIEISQERLSQWPEKGDLAEMNKHLHILEDDESSNNDDNSKKPASHVEDPKNSDKDNAEEVKIDRDGTDEGPAPLQNTEIPLSFEGVMIFLTIVMLKLVMRQWLLKKLIRQLIESEKTPCLKTM